MSKHKIDEGRMLMFVEIINDDGDEEEIALPIEFEVCPMCSGKGKHVHPDIDGHGISMDEWNDEWSYEEQEAYMSGGYDVTCYECNGKRVIPVIDEKKADSKALKQWDDQQRAIAELEAEERAERRFGC